MQTRKMKGLKRKAKGDEDVDMSNHDESEGGSEEDSL
jgi:hypothetical protein